MPLHTPSTGHEENTNPNNQIANALDSSVAERDQLAQLVKNTSGITVEEINSDTLVISVSDLRAVDGIVKNSSSTHKHVAKLAKTIYTMIQQGVPLSVSIETFVGKPYLLHSIQNFPDREIGEAVKYACEARSQWAKQRITKPSHELPQLTGVPITVIDGKYVSDKQELIYTIQFKQENADNDKQNS